MCGIFGMIGNVPEELKVEAHILLRNLFRASIVRGKDASGFSAIHDEPRARLITEKRGIKSTSFVKKSKFFKALRLAPPSILIGHTRATTGSSPKFGRNNHPFNNQTHSMIHNGVVREWKEAVKSNGLELRSETDSEVILRLFERNSDPVDGVQSVLDNVSPRSDMAVALLKHGGDNGISLSLFRNTGRPAYIVASPAMRALFFCSTDKIFERAVRMTWPKTYKNTATAMGFEISEVPPFEYFEWRLNEHGNFYQCKRESLKRPPVTKVASTNFPTSNGWVKNSHGVYVKSLPAPREISDSEALRKKAKTTKANSNKTQIDVDRLIKASEESMAILNALQSSQTITALEIKHWKKWRDK